MRYLRCTQKLLKEMDVKISLDNEVSDNEIGLGDWYVNLLRIDRRKCLLFTNEKTLYSFIVPKVLKKHILNIKNEFIVNLTYNLQYEGFARDSMYLIEKEYSNIAIDKTISKSVLGSMTDMVNHLFYFLSDPRTEGEPHLGDVNRRLNRIPFSAIGYKYSLDLMKEKVDQQYHVSRLH